MLERIRITRTRSVYGALAAWTTVLAGIGLAMVSSGCTPGVVGAPEELPPFSASCDRCARWIEGSFTNTRPEGSTGGGSEFVLHQVRVWGERSDGIWIYSELREAGAGDRALQQVMFRLTDDLDGGLLMETYRLPGGGARYLEAWKAPSMFYELTPTLLEPEVGCALVLRQDREGGFSGSGGGRTCPSRLPGSRYQSTDLKVGPLEITLWLRGFDQDGRQAFGPESFGWLMNRMDASRDPVSKRPV